eukprot:8258184-Pyramimonas_sp.AAC.1
MAAGGVHRNSLCCLSDCCLFPISPARGASLIFSLASSAHGVRPYALCPMAFCPLAIWMGPGDPEASW